MGKHRVGDAREGLSGYCVYRRGGRLPLLQCIGWRQKKTVWSSIFVDLFLRCTIDIYLKDPCEEKITGPKL